MIPIENSDAILVPCFGFSPFRATEERDAYHHTRPHAGPEDIQRYDAGIASYLPRDASMYRTPTDILSARGDEWIKLRSLEERVIAHNVVLCVEGPRQFFMDENRSMPNDLDRLFRGYRHCYSVWGRQNEDTVHGWQHANHISVSALRSGRAVIFAHTMMHDHRGEPTRVRTTVSRVEFAIHDSNPERDDMLHIESRTFTWFSELGEPLSKADLGGDDTWTALQERARRGFEEHYAMMPTEIETWRVLHLAQQEAMFADDNRFFHDVSALRDWEQALRLAEQPWQLGAVIRAYANESQFHFAPGNPGTLGMRVEQMLRTHVCHESRRAQLRNMVREFVQPRAGSSWNLRSMPGDD